MTIGEFTVVFLLLYWIFAIYFLQLSKHQHILVSISIFVFLLKVLLGRIRIFFNITIIVASRRGLWQMVEDLPFHVAFAEDASLFLDIAFEDGS